MVIGKKGVKEIADATKLFCQEMQMTPEQQDKFTELIQEIVKYSLYTSADCAKSVGGIKINGVEIT